HEAIALFALCGVVFALFALGLRTRLLHFLSFVLICSLHNRLIFFDDGSEITTRLLVFWTLFLPMGARFSFYAVRTRLRAEPIQAATNPGELASEPAPPSPAISLVVPAILLQLVVIYLFNALHKDGDTWRDGSAVHYVLHQDRIVTWLGWKLRP